MAIPTHWVDPLAVGDDDGSSEANAWTTTQRAIDGTDGVQPATGDNVFCKHTGVAGAVDETVAATIDVDGNDGDTTDGYINFLAVNSLGVEDGSKYVIDFESAVGTDGLKFAADYIHFRNFIFLNSAASGVTTDGIVNKMWLEHVEANLCAGSGFSIAAVIDGLFTDCVTNNNTATGIYKVRDSLLIRPVAIGNGAYGIRTFEHATVCDPLVAGSGNYNIYFASKGNHVYGGVSDGSAVNGVYGAAGAVGCSVTQHRITHNGGKGIISANAAGSILASRCVLFGNGDDSLGTGVVDDGTCHGPAGDATIVTVANRDVTADGYVKHRYVAFNCNGTGGNWATVELGYWVNGEDGFAGTYDGIVTKLPTGADSGFGFRITAGEAPDHGEGGFTIEATEGSGSVYACTGNAKVQLTGTDATDYSTAPDADVRRVEVDLGNGSVWVTAGFAPADWSLPAVGKVIEGTSYRDETRDGTYHEATEAEVEELITFGADGELTGTLVAGVGANTGNIIGG